MAFFKFRLPGNSPAVAAEAHVTHSGDSVEVVRRRARHRLIGSVVLVFVAVVAFPLLFDSQPRPVAVDTPILVPDRHSTPPLVAGTPVPSPQAPAKPLLPAAPAVAPAPVSAQASLEPGKEEVVAPAKPAAVTSEPADKPVQAQAPAPKASQPAVPARTEAKDKPATKSADDGQKAKALLEGKNASAEHAAKMVIQVGAFSDADKVREVRRKLEQAGLKTYTQSIEGKDGKRTTRIRVGPFESRAEADKAIARVRKLDLPANLISL
jgi:DedD protein